eukprot:RCo020625
MRLSENEGIPQGSKKGKKRPKACASTASCADPSSVFCHGPVEGELVCGGVFFTFVLAVYLRTLHPSVAGGDSGELMAVAHELGTAHPPGYPTFTMYSKLSEVVLGWGSMLWWYRGQGQRLA